VKVGIEAPVEISVHRQEVYDEIQGNNREALTQSREDRPELPKLGKKKDNQQLAPAVSNT